MNSVQSRKDCAFMVPLGRVPAARLLIVFCSKDGAMILFVCVFQVRVKWLSDNPHRSRDARGRIFAVFRCFILIELRTN